MNAQEARVVSEYRMSQNALLAFQIIESRIKEAAERGESSVMYPFHDIGVNVQYKDVTEVISRFRANGFEIVRHGCGIDENKHLTIKW